MTIMAPAVRMSLGVVRHRWAGGNGTEPPRRDKGRSGEHKPDSRGRTSLPPRCNVRPTARTTLHPRNARYTAECDGIAVSGSETVRRSAR